MTAATCEAPLQTRRIYSEKPSEKPGPFVKAKKLRVVQLGSYPASNRGARSNLINIHERLQARGHESIVIDLTPYHRVKQPGVHYPHTMMEVARLLLRYSRRCGSSADGQRTDSAEAGAGSDCEQATASAESVYAAFGWTLLSEEGPAWMALGR